MEHLRLLIVDDSVLMRDIIRESIEDAFPEAEASVANNGDEAQKLLARRQFDLVLCDWEMPALKGDQLLQWLRQESSQRNLPFIMITAKGEKASILEAKKLGVTDYIVKPFTSDTLCRKVRALAGGAGADAPAGAEQRR